MSACEKCWADAYGRFRLDPSKPQSEHYRDLLREREANPCSPAQQRGDWCYRHHVECDEKHECALCVAEDVAMEAGLEREK